NGVWCLCVICTFGKEVSGRVGSGGRLMFIVSLLWGDVQHRLSERRRTDLRISSVKSIQGVRRVGQFTDVRDYWEIPGRMTVPEKPVFLSKGDPQEVDVLW